MSANPEPDKLSPEETNRLWQHGIHEDQIFNSRLHFFLALETMLIGVVALLLSNFVAKSNPNENEKGRDNVSQQSEI